MPAGPTEMAMPVWRVGGIKRAAACLLFCVWFAAMSGCAHTSAKDDSLYQALGGRPGIAALVDRFLYTIADDLRIVHYFAETNIPRFRRLLAEHFCELSGGPCEYTGDSMRVVHEPMRLTEADFNAMVENLMDSMDALKLPVQTQNRLLARLAPMHGDIVSN